jgi:hypothetical protein
MEIGGASTPPIGLAMECLKVGPMTAVADRLFDSRLTRREARIRDNSVEPGAQENGRLGRGRGDSITDGDCRDGEEVTGVCASGSEGDSTTFVPITDLKNLFVLSFRPASFPKIIEIVLRLLCLLDLGLRWRSAATRAICIRCGRTVLAWKTGGTGYSSRFTARCRFSGR